VVVDSVEWLEVRKEDKEHNHVNMYLGLDEMTRLFTGTGVAPNPLIRESVDNGLQNTNIAISVPPQFVTKREYKTDYSLTKTAFQCLRAHFTKLCVAQRLFHRVAGQHNRERCTVLSELSTALKLPMVSVMDQVDTAEVTICHLLVLAQMDNLNMALEMGSSSVLAGHTEDSVKVASAEAWVKKNWSSVIAMEPKQGKRSPRTPPALGDTQAWVKWFSSNRLEWGSRRITTVKAGSRHTSLHVDRFGEL
jgi:hypothetical protein